MANAPGSSESFASLYEQSAGAKGRQRRYHPGESVEVTIVAIARDAVFADLGGKQEGVFERVALSDPDGKLHIEVGGKVTAVVDNVDGATGQVRLRPVVIRTADAGDIGVVQAHTSAGAAAPTLVTGARVKGKVTGIERYGVFVQIAGSQGRSGRGLVPSMETGTPRNADLKKHFSVGQEVEAKILAVDETGKIRLSFAALGADDERGRFEAFKTQSAAGAEGAAPAAGDAAARNKEKPAPRGFGKLGDILAGVSVAKPAPAPKAAPTAKAAPAKRGPAAAPTGGARRPKA